MRRGDAAAAAAPAPASAADAIEDADDYHRQLLVVRRLHDAGASRERVAAAAATLRALKAKTWVPRGTTSRKKKRAKLAAGGLQDASGAGDDATAATAATDARAVATYPPPDLPPVDADGFVLAFDAPSIAPGVEPSNARAEDVRVDADAIAHWRRYGFVVFRDVLTREECAATRDEIWDYLEATHRHRGAALSRDDANTWHALSSDTYGLAPEPSVFTPRCVMNRQNPKVIACLAAALSSFPDGDAGDGGGDDADAARVSVSPRDVIVSQDRWCLYRPTRGLSLRRRPSADDDVENGRETTVTTTELVDKPEWKTRGNLHLDLNPFTYGDDALNARALDDDDDVSVSVSDTNVAGNDGHVDDAIGPRAKADRLPFEHARDFSKETNAVSAASGPHVQGVIALADNRVEDGGTVLVPGFHATFAKWSRALGSSWRAYAETHADADANRLVWRGDGAGSFKFGDRDAIHERKTRVTAREGSYVIWDQRLAHGAAPNDSDVPRIAQFVKGFRREGAGRGRLRRRARFIERALEANGTSGVVSALGRRVFALDTL